MPFKHAVPHSEGFLLSPVTSVREAAVSDVFPFLAQASLYSLQNGPYVPRSVIPFSEPLDPSRPRLQPR